MVHGEQHFQFKNQFNPEQRSAERGLLLSLGWTCLHLWHITHRFFGSKQLYFTFSSSNHHLRNPSAHPAYCFEPRCPLQQPPSLSSPRREGGSLSLAREGALSEVTSSEADSPFFCQVKSNQAGVGEAWVNTFDFYLPSSSSAGVCTFKHSPWSFKMTTGEMVKVRWPASGGGEVVIYGSETKKKNNKISLQEEKARKLSAKWTVSMVRFDTLYKTRYIKRPL